MAKKRITKTELLYFIALGLFLIVQLLSSTLLSALIDFTILRLICFFTVVTLLTLKLIIDNNHKHLWIYLLVLVLFLIVGLRATNIRDLLILGFLTLEARNIEFRKIVKVDVALIGMVLLITCLLFFMGAYNSVDTSTVRAGDLTKRLSLGFGWTTYAPNYFMSFVIGVIFLKPKRKYKWILITCAALINYILYIATDTKAAYYETFVLLIIVIFMDIFKIRLTKYKIVRIVLPLVYVLCGAFAIWISLNFTNSNPIMRAINEFTTYRLSLAHHALEVYSVGLWGNPVEWITGSAVGWNAYFYVDSSYIQILIQYGILVYAYVIILFTILIRHYVYRNENAFLACLIIIAVHSITDPQLFNLAYNPFLLSLGLVLKEWKSTTDIIRCRQYQRVKNIKVPRGVI